ncbi:HAD-IB family hydrolase [Modestobacter sp. I12A-02628]|uniref:HAD-IB family hydrolase n=1 Tax=Goekera deserti TaxID=2497753 RepID=A0A7K3WA05_9ACTN|nr:HAD-IB family hydrolase [Goekera deserti]MPR00490.1 HAD-IB family hydrolase [Goekera deserti]NDI49111.1 HAD-IB family hydrolase [Goekera deserti]NEL52849.1 HAD-IB family hydrolase [Goekera deserti]
MFRGARARIGSGTADPEARALAAGNASAAAAEVEPPAAVTPDLTAAAFFDVDNTMMMGASLFWFARGLAARQYFDGRDVASFFWQQAKFRIAGSENAADMHTVRDNALAFVAGRSVSEIEGAGEEIYDELMADRIWPGTRMLAQEHLAAGQRVWLVTATPVQLATVISHRLGLTGALGTVSEVVDGKFTGRLVGEMMHGEAKAQAVRALAEREGLDLSRCTAYSDSSNDLPMLSLVGRAVAINPDAELKAVARSRGWVVKDYRTGRKAARIGVPTVGAAALGGGVVGGVLALRRAQRWPFQAPPPPPLPPPPVTWRSVALQLATRRRDVGLPG